MEAQLRTAGHDRPSRRGLEEHRRDLGLTLNRLGSYLGLSCKP
jgi:hypothetical protein